ncbi:MAG: GyrI-like domain-containing protein [bacterium]
MEKIDLKREYKKLYSPSSKEVELIDVPEFNFIMIDGAIEKGMEPGNSPSFAEAVEALYGLSYTLKFMAKKRDENPVDYSVMPLEGLWWVEDGNFDINIKDNWFWSVRILQPDFITEEMFKQTKSVLNKKKNNPSIDKTFFGKFKEGLSVQMMHIGPYSTEPETVAKMNKFIAKNGYKFNGMHHEIYLSDPRKAKQEKMKTILRHPVSE